MASNARRDAALNLLAATGMRRSNYAPPGVRLLWLLGVDAPPPHFATFPAAALVTGSVFGIFFGLADKVLRGVGFPSRPMSLPEIATIALTVGVMNASYYAHGRRKHRLPSWRELDRGGSPS